VRGRENDEKTTRKRKKTVDAATSCKEPIPIEADSLGLHESAFV
jgi:hypothetical protein